MQKEIVMPFKYRTAFITSIIFVIIGLLFICFSDSNIYKKTLVGLCTAMFFWYLLRFTYRRLFNNKPSTIINATGIYLYDDIGSETWINWTDIVKIKTETVNGNKQLQLFTRTKQRNFSLPKKTPPNENNLLENIKSFPQSKQFEIYEENPKSKLDKFKIKYKFIFVEAIIPIIIGITLLNFATHLTKSQLYYLLLFSMVFYLPLVWFFDPPVFFIKGKLHVKFYLYCIVSLLIISVSIKYFLFDRFGFLSSLIIAIVIWVLQDFFITPKLYKYLGVKDLTKDDKS